MHHLITSTVTQRQLLQLLGTAGIRNIFASQGGIRVQIASPDDDAEDERRWANTRSRRREPAEPYKWPPVPHPEGQKLIEEGTFGSNEPLHDMINRRHKKKLAYRTMMRELGLKAPGIERGASRALRQEMIPSAKPDMTINFDARGYCGQFSDDGNFFFTCAQDFRVRMYDTSNPYDWKFYKKVLYYGGQWTITDATLSPDNKYLAYSSIRPQACLAPTDPNDSSQPLSLDFSNSGSDGRPRRSRYEDHWGVSYLFVNSLFDHALTLPRYGPSASLATVAKLSQAQAMNPSTSTTLKPAGPCYKFQDTRTTSMPCATATNPPHTFSSPAQMTPQSKSGTEGH